MCTDSNNNGRLVKWLIKKIISHKKIYQKTGQLNIFINIICIKNKTSMFDFFVEIKLKKICLNIWVKE